MVKQSACLFLLAICLNAVSQERINFDNIRVINSRGENIVFADTLYKVPYTLLQFQPLSNGYKPDETSLFYPIFEKYRDWGFNALSVTDDKNQWHNWQQNKGLPWSILLDETAQLETALSFNPMASNNLMNRSFLIKQNIGANELEKLLHKILVVPYINRVAFEPE